MIGVIVHTLTVVPRAGLHLTAAELVAYFREHLANFEVPRSFVIVEDLPRNAAGTIVKGVLRARELD